MKLNKQVKVLVLTGDGINCEVETAEAFKQFEATTEILHIADLIERPEKLLSSHILAFPGGFSFGDELGSGQILALKLKHTLGAELKKFVEDKKLIIGICNGFQALVRLGLLPEPFAPRSMTLTHNRQGHFINRWVDLKTPTSKCIWTNKIDSPFALPIRHGEGRIVFSGDEKTQNALFEKLMANGQVALQYTEDVNGSYAQIAGVCDPTGRIFGLMPHPEAAMSAWLSPGGQEKNSEVGPGAALFENGIKYCQKNLLEKF